MTSENATRLEQRLRFAELLRERPTGMSNPRDLPAGYGIVVKSLDQLLEMLHCDAVLCGSCAVWYYGFVGTIPQDIDIVLPEARVHELVDAAVVSGFEKLPRPPGRWPKLQHQETAIQVDILPEGARPGTASRPAPTTIPHPSRMGAKGSKLCYIDLPSLIELKLGAGRARDESDVVELVRVNPKQLDAIRQHLAAVSEDYTRAFDQLVQRAREQGDD
jgi:hypothetical protein